MRTSALPLLLALFNRSVRSVHDFHLFTLEYGDRLARVAAQLDDHMDTLVEVRPFPRVGAADSRSLRSNIYVRMHHLVRRYTYVPFRRCLGDVRREFMQRIFIALHGTLGSYLRHALQEGNADAVAFLPIPRV
jgi:hypothetical protein